MQTEAVFENIAERIQQEISQAKKSIYIAVAWFTNIRLFNELVRKASDGCSVSIIISDDSINENSHIDFDRLSSNNSRVYKAGNGDTELMHNKFCIIDYSTVITGSYNWSYKAASNFENVIITRDDTKLAGQFISEFNNICKRYYQDEPATEIVFPIDKIIKRLEVIKNYILLEEIDELNKETIKLRGYKFNTEIDEIIEDISKKEFSSAIIKIQNFIAKNHQLSIWIDPIVAALRLEMKIIENQVNAFDNEKIELEKLLSEFQHRHSIELGNIILEILRLRKIKFKTEEAENDERYYRDQLKEDKAKVVYELTDEEKIILKKKFRKASNICHPDKVSDEFKDAAHKTFIELKTAYDSNDLKKVIEILTDLEKGNFFRSFSDTLSEKDLLQTAIEKLRKRIIILEKEITAIKESETFKMIISIENFDEYFAKTKQQLKEELETLVLTIEK